MAIRLLLSLQFIFLFGQIITTASADSSLSNVQGVPRTLYSLKTPFLIHKNVLFQDSVWPILTTTAVDVFTEQDNPEAGSYLVIALFQASALKPATQLLDKLSQKITRLQYMTFLLGDKQTGIQSNGMIKNVFIANRNKISSLVMLIDDNVLVDHLLDDVLSTNSLVVSGVIHTTEWMIVSSNNETLSYLQEKNPNIDFITLVFPCSPEVTCVAQKSRNETLRVTARVGTKAGLCTNCTHNAQHSYNTHKVYTNGNIRKTASTFLNSQKSIISGMTLPVGWIDSEHYKLATLNRTGNVTTCGGYSGSLLKLLATSLGFTFDFVTVTDGQQYGVIHDHILSGLVGVLARREAALTTLPITSTPARFPFLDYLYVSTFKDTVFVIYRVPHRSSDLELIYVSIFEPEFLYTHLGPVLFLALVGALVYVLTRSCSTKRPVALSRGEARHLLTFPEHICFHDSMTYPGQTGRILRATWSIFWFIMCSAYVAFLATTFTVKPPEVAINTFQKMSEAKDFNIGILTVASAIVEYIFQNQNRTVAKVWEKLEKQNKTDRHTFDLNFERQANRVINGNYLLLTGYCITVGICDEFLTGHLADLRVFALNFGYMFEYTYVATPKDIFYEKDLHRVLLNFEDMGILSYLREFHFRPRLLKRLESSRFNDASKVVTFHRILVPVYMSLCGIGVSVVCLGLEVMYGRWRGACRSE